ncbi:peptidase [Streptomyces sp. NPDC059897]|uniref:peptidase n=1 Tax=Streptomyces sp. NPDC059897 TaxID=3346994 RepID=UPI003653FD39
MKLRRALAAAAATAALAPLALLSAPAAFADGAPTDTTTATGTASPSPSVSASPSTSPSPSASATTASPGPTTSSPEAPRPKKADDARTGKTEPSDECTAGEDSPGTLAELRGLPSKIVAGSGWHGFTFRVTNMTDQDFASARAQVYAFSFAYEDESDTSRYLRLQWFDGTAWRDLDNDVEHDASFPASGPLARGAHSDVRLRISVDAKTPAGAGAGLALAVSVDPEGVCGFSVPEDAYWDFDILAAGASPGQVPPAGGHTGSPTGSPKPSATASASASSKPSPQASSTPVGGSLASTGAGSTLPVFGAAAGIAVVAGGGVLYAVRRRKVSNEA